MNSLFDHRHIDYYCTSAKRIECMWCAQFPSLYYWFNMFSLWFAIPRAIQRLLATSNKSTSKMISKFSIESVWQKKIRPLQIMQFNIFFSLFVLFIGFKWLAFRVVSINAYYTVFGINAHIICGPSAFFFIFLFFQNPRVPIHTISFITNQSNCVHNIGHTWFIFTF